MQKNFARISSGVDVEPLLAAINAAPNLWNEITARQTTPGSPHKSTETIFLRWAESQTLDAVFNEIPAVDYPAMEKLPEARDLIMKLLSGVDGIELGRAIIVKLKPDGFITPHADEGAYADHFERFHICLSASRGNGFFVGTPEANAELVCMKPGEAWWFNHKMTHWVVNESSEDRIHLIIDCVAPTYRRERHAVSA